MALSGGKTPRGLYERLASAPWRDQIDWGRAHVFLVDERAVPAEHPDSNFGMLRRALLDQVPIPPAQVFPMASGRPLEEDAAQYEESLLRVLPKEGPRGWPRFDCMALGLGPDGHTASLFPGHPALFEAQRLALALPEPMGDPAWPRLTLTLPLINNTRSILFLASGAGKRRVVESILEGHAGIRDIVPAARVQAVEELAWFLDGAMT